MEYIREILATNLQRLRKSRGYTQAQLAMAIGSTAASYNRWENGINWPDPESIEKIASYYQVKSSALFQDPSLVAPVNSSDYLKDLLLKDIELIINKYKS